MHSFKKGNIYIYDYLNIKLNTKIIIDIISAINAIIKVPNIM